jgi:hypothetical protein
MNLAERPRCFSPYGWRAEVYIRYLHGLATARDFYAGESKTDPKDAFVLADLARAHLRRDVARIESRWAYDRKRANGEHHNQAVLCLAQRRVDVLHAMLSGAPAPPFINLTAIRGLTALWGSPAGSNTRGRRTGYGLRTRDQRQHLGPLILMWPSRRRGYRFTAREVSQRAPQTAFDRVSVKLVVGPLWSSSSSRTCAQHGPPGLARVLGSTDQPWSCGIRVRYQG